MVCKWGLETTYKSWDVTPSAGNWGVSLGKSCLSKIGRFFSGEVRQQVFHHGLPHKKEDLDIGYRLLGGSSQD